MARYNSLSCPLTTARFAVVASTWLSIWTMILFLFKTLLSVSHVVTSPHTLLVKDIVFTSWGMIVNITSSKTIQRGKPHQIPVSSIENKALCPVYLLNFFFNYSLGQEVRHCLF